MLCLFACRGQLTMEKWEKYRKRRRKSEMGASWILEFRTNATSIHLSSSRKNGFILSRRTSSSIHFEIYLRSALLRFWYQLSYHFLGENILLSMTKLADVSNMLTKKVWVQRPKYQIWNLKFWKQGIRLFLRISMRQVHILDSSFCISMSPIVRNDLVGDLNL